MARNVSSSKAMPLDTSTTAPAHTAAEAFYAESLRQLKESGIPFLVAGTYAVSSYTGIQRPTKDIDVFCRAGDYPRILNHFVGKGYEAEIEDDRWLGKVRKGPLFFDVIFNSMTNLTPVNDRWFADAHTAEVLGIEVLITPPTELIWSKAFVQHRYKYDGADVAHIILRQNESIDWKRRLSYMDQYWEVLLIHLLNFRFIYPTERHLVPGWLMEELLNRLAERDRLPAAQTRICRGRLFSPIDYTIDVTEWGFVDVVGESIVKK